MKLVIGNKNYSSWSLRPWLLLSAHDVEFTEVPIPLDVAGYKAEIEKHSAAGKVPVLIDGDLVVWDSLAICEYVSEKYLDSKGWPEEEKMRAEARSYSAEMHSSFFALRNEMPMNCRATGRRVAMTADLQKDISRIDGLWSGLRAQYREYGKFLFGKFSIADCMFAPVAFRFNTYAPELSETSQEYVRTILDHAKIREWLEAAKKEEETIKHAEMGL